MTENKNETTNNEVEETELNEEQLENVSGGILIGLLKNDSFFKFSPSPQFCDGSVRNSLPAVQKNK
jgi:bacteriocin-like protein